MCGIAGVIGGGARSEELAAAMQAALRHRGPDDNGLLLIDGAVLAHCRLSILDLTPAGAQPMWDATRSACIAYNGEIYNFAELREECIARGAEFRSRSDTEVILNLYLLDGAKAFQRLNGMFAFCLVDPRAKLAYLVRDPMGIKPLYYAPTERGLFFASELGGLVAAGAVPFEVDHSALQAYLQLDYVPSPACMVHGVRKLEPGQLAIVDSRGAVRTEMYEAWDDVRTSSVPFKDSLEEFGRRMRQVVRRQMVADVPVGVFLSGGIDSTIIATELSGLSGKIDTFSIAFAEASFDERRFFEDVARRLGARQHTKEVTPRDMLDVIPLIARITSEPLADGSIVPTFLLSAFARESVKVVLSGDGADELFGGYPTYGLRRTASVMSRLPPRVRSAMSRAADALLPVSYDNLTTSFKTRKFLAGLHRDPLLRHHRWLGSFLPEELPGLLRAHDPSFQAELERSLLDPVRGFSGLEALLRSDQRFYMQEQVLAKVDRASMAASLEVRVPFLDREMVTFARSLPADQKVARGRTKRLLRAYAGTRFPASIAERPKKGFGVPLGAWFRGDLRQLVGDLLRGRTAQEFFDRNAVEALLQAHWSGRADNRKKIFNLLSFVLWHDQFSDGSRRSGEDL